MTYLLVGVFAFLGGWLVRDLVSRRVERLRERFFSFLAHELNTQITGLQLTSENLLSGVFGKLPDEHRRWVQAIDNRVDLLGCMIGDFRDAAHWEFGGQVRLVTEPVDLAEMIGKEMKRLIPSAERSKIRLETRLSPALPSVMADPNRLRRVLSALYQNAMKFSSSGGTISLEASVEQEKVRLVLRYTNEDPNRDTDRILDIHYSVLQEGHALRCVGIGLGLSRRILQGSGGDILFEEKDQGLMAFTLSLPIVKESDASAAG